MGGWLAGGDQWSGLDSLSALLRRPGASSAAMTHLGVTVSAGRRRKRNASGSRAAKHFHS